MWGLGGARSFERHDSNSIHPQAARTPPHHSRRLPGSVRRARRQRLRGGHRHRQEHQERDDHRQGRQEPLARHEQAESTRGQLADRRARPAGAAGREGRPWSGRPHRPDRSEGRHRPGGPAGSSGSHRRQRLCGCRDPSVRGHHDPQGPGGQGRGRVPTGQEGARRRGRPTTRRTRARRVVESTPADTGTGWTALVYNDGDSSFESYAWATCANVG